MFNYVKLYFLNMNFFFFLLRQWHRWNLYTFWTIFLHNLVIKQGDICHKNLNFRHMPENLHQFKIVSLNSLSVFPPCLTDSCLVSEGFDMQKFMMSSSLGPSGQSTIIVAPEDDTPHRVKAMDDQEREKTYMSKATVERNRVNRIRKARMSAEIIQRSWRRYLLRKRLSERKKKWNWIVLF